MKYLIETKRGRRAEIPSSGFISLSIIATFYKDSDVYMTELEMACNHGHKDYYPVIQDMIFEIKNYNYTKGLRNFRRLSERVYFDQ